MALESLFRFLRETSKLCDLRSQQVDRFISKVVKPLLKKNAGEIETSSTVVV